MTANEIRQKYLDFMRDKGHAIIPAAPLVQENDSSTLFTPFGMQQMVPFLKGEAHPMGTRLADSQPCFRADDIEEVGDNRHTTFFEMLGNWSLGDYFKEEQLSWFFEFLTQIVGLDPNKLYVTVFAGDQYIQKDEESITIWQKLFNTQNPAKPGIDGFDQNTKIYMYPAKKNWWSRAGVPENMPVGEIGGPDSEVFFDFGEELLLHENSSFKEEKCHINCDCGRFMEIGNSVFMQYIKNDDGSFSPLPKQNVDFGGGLERIAAASNNDPDVFKIDLFSNIIQEIEITTEKKYEGEYKLPMRIIADHLKAAAFIIKGGISPSNKAQGYFLRRLIRRATVKLHQLGCGLDSSTFETIVDRGILRTYEGDYFERSLDRELVFNILNEESNKFSKALDKGLKIIQSSDQSKVDGKFAFDLYQSYGFPLELTEELVKEKGIIIDRELFRTEFKKHQDQSRSASAGMFKGGLADHSEIITAYHTTTHLLHQALRDVLGDHVQQMGSNITNERLRFDFKHPEKLTEDQKQQIIDIINQKIADKLPVHKTIEDKEQALKSGAMAFFKEKYPDKVSVYTIGQDPESDWYSKELCGGPHVANTGDIKPVMIKKEEAVGSGVRRVYLVFK